MDNRLLILLLIALMIYTYVTCYSGSATELFAYGTDPNSISGLTPENKNIILAEAKGSWYKSCGVESAQWNSSSNKLTATCTNHKGRGTEYIRKTIKCPNRKFKNKNGRLQCE